MTKSLTYLFSMKLAQLKTIVKRGESEQLEFKKSTASLSSAFQTICAFLNSKLGGTVIFGITDNGALVGQPVTDKTRKDISIEIQKIDPAVHFDIEYVRIQADRYAIIMSVNPGEQAPYTYDDRPFIRTQSVTSRMSKDEYRAHCRQNDHMLWESLTNRSLKITDLDSNRIKEIVRLAISQRRLPESAITASVGTILKKFNLLRENELTNGAIVLFGKNEHKQLIQSNIQLARFKGNNKREFLDNKLYRGNAFDLYDQAMLFLTSHLSIGAEIKENSSIRVEKPTIPHTVLREALTNALVHRDYSKANGAISIALYENRLTITNAGPLPEGVKLSHLTKEHPSSPRNPVIAHLFYIAGKIEKWGRGTLDIIEQSQKAGNPPPIYEEIGNNFSVTLPFRASDERALPISNTLDRALTDRQKNIVALLKQGPLTRQQILEKLELSLTNRTMQKELSKLQQLQLIKSQGKARNITWALANSIAN